MRELLDAIETLKMNRLISLLNQCTEPQQDMFRRMYGHTLPKGTSPKTVVENMDKSCIFRAIEQVEATIKKNRENPSLLEGKERR